MKNNFNLLESHNILFKHNLKLTKLILNSISYFLINKRFILFRY